MSLPRLAYIGLDRQLWVTDVEGGAPQALTRAMPRPGGAWSMLKGPSEAWAWPAWSPGGDWIAAFAIESGDDVAGPARLVALSLDGIREEELATLGPNVPLYAQWHPAGDAVSVLTQQNDELVLSIVRRSALGRLRPVEHGVPLFFNWAADGSRLLVHVGGSDGDGRLLLRDPLGHAEDVLLDRPPGSFCAPVFVEGRAVYAVRQGPVEGRSEVVVSDPDGSHPMTLVERRGLLALVGGPGDRVAVSSAPRGEGTPYHGLDLVRITDGAVENVTETDCLAFFWAPDGTWLLYARVDPAGNCLTWYRAGLDGSAPVELGTFWPTRDLLFYLHFFDQYAASHSLISADSRYVVFAGYPAGGGQADLSMPPRVYVKDASDPARPAWEVARGSFAVFAPV